MTSLTTWGGDGPELILCGVEALNGLGFNAHQTWALRRADVRALSESPFRAWNGEPISMGHIGVLPDDEFGATRFHSILTDLLKRWPRWIHGRVQPGRLVSALVLPERFAAESTHVRFSKERTQLTEIHRDTIGAIVSDARCEVHAYGHGGAAYSVQWAGQLLAAGHADVALVAGIDSSFDPDVVEGMLAREQLHLGGLDGRIPGEGGALLVIATARFAREQGWPTLARLAGASVGAEPRCASVSPNFGVGLASTVGALADSLAARGERVDWWLGDVSNEPYRVREFQLAFPRFTAQASHGASLMEFIPTHFGDLGAATIPTALTIAVEAFSRGAPPVRNCVAWASSHGPTRGAVLIEQPAGRQP